MQPDINFWTGKRVCVTGGTGFFGWHIVQQLRALTPHVRIFGLPPASKRLAAQLKEFECVFGDVRDAAAVARALHDCQIVFHTAGPVAVWGPILRDMRAIHVQGTENILRALPHEARLVHTSSVVAVGAAKGPQALTEDAAFNLRSIRVDYVHAKKEAEELALTAAAAGQDVVVVNPSYMVGPMDYERSVMGRFCVRFWLNVVPLIPPGSFDFVDVRDAACGALLAAERGRRGRRYILAGEHRTLREFTRHLAEIRGMSMWWRLSMPSWVYVLVAFLAECGAALWPGEPYPSPQSACISCYDWRYLHDRARTELGFQPRPLYESLVDAHQWFQQTRVLKPIGNHRTN
jgi:dihydroflavonol-4-reductase